jgi:hypothetical protein
MSSGAAASASTEGSELGRSERNRKSGNQSRERAALSSAWLTLAKALEVLTENVERQ